MKQSSQFQGEGSFVSSLGESAPPAAVLFLVFNRPDTTTKVLDAIRHAKPARLYVAADGPREGRVAEAIKVAQVRAIATTVDWPCEVKTLFHDRNLGCKMAVSSAITWFFEHEDRGIIIEDDCLPHPDFFKFCEVLLERYANDQRIAVITGNNFQGGIKRGEASYYFSKYNHCWGWATWRRAWKHYQGDLQFLAEWTQSPAWRDWLPDPGERRYWRRIFEQVSKSRIDTWDYSWTASVWYHRGLTATPNVNLVSNIGFRPDATHTTSMTSPLARIATHNIGSLVHPKEIQPNQEADQFVFDHVFDGKWQRFPRFLFRIPREVTYVLFRWLKKSLTGTFAGRV